MAQASERPRGKRLSWESRCEIVSRIEQGVSPPLAAAGGGASRASGYRLWRRYRQGGWVALRDRRSTAHRQPRRLCAEAEQAILAARRRSAFGPVRLAGLVPHPPSTIGKVLRRHGCSRLPRPESLAARCARRYERDRPGELLHIDTKKLGRFWEPGKRVLGEQAGRPHRNRLVRSARCPDRARVDRQREGLPRARLDRGTAPARDRAPLYAHLPPAHERQGRALHPDAANRVRLCPQLPLEQRPSPSARRLPALVQQTPTPQLAASPATDQPRLTPLWSRQLIWSEVCQVARLEGPRLRACFVGGGSARLIVDAVVAADMRGSGPHDRVCDRERSRLLESSIAQSAARGCVAGRSSRLAPGRSPRRARCGCG
jgi:hypothetical protein